MKAAKVTLLVIDMDELGESEISSVIENQKYPNYCINPRVMSIEMADIGDWHDGHPFNHANTSDAEYVRLFQSELAALREKNAELQRQLDVTDALLNARNEVLQAIPACQVHGNQCVPHALDWVKSAIKQLDELTTQEPVAWIWRTGRERM